MNMLFTNILPEVFVCCLETCNVYVMLLIMCTNFHGHSWPLLLTLGTYRYI